MSADLKCRCGEPLTAPDTGRPPRYCSVSCRRSAEYDLRRQQALLLRAEKALQDARCKAATSGFTVDVKRAAWWAAEVDRLADYLEQSLILEDQE